MCVCVCVCVVVQRHDLASQLTTAPIRKISRLGHGMVEDVEEGMADGVSFYRVWLQGGPAPGQWWGSVM